MLRPVQERVKAGGHAGRERVEDAGTVEGEEEDVRRRAGDGDLVGVGWWELRRERSHLRDGFKVKVRPTPHAQSQS